MPTQAFEQLSLPGRDKLKGPGSRLLMIPTDLPGPNGLYAQQRADWEVARRYGRSREVQITVTGFRESAGVLWEVNTVVNIRCRR